MRKKIKVHHAVSTEELITHVQGLIDGIKANRMRFERGKDFLVLAPKEPVDFTFEVKVDDEDAKCTIAFSWPVMDSNQEQCALRISDGRQIIPVQEPSALGMETRRRGNCPSRPGSSAGARDHAP